MRKIVILMLSVFAFATSAEALSYNEARNRAWYLTDKMAYELNLTEEQYNKAYEINLDYFMSVNTPMDAEGVYWQYRNTDLRYILFDWQYNLFAATSYFFRPLLRVNGIWVLASYNIYDRDFYYFSRPVIFNVYKGRSWRRRPHVSPYRHFHIVKGHGMRDRYLEARHHTGPRREVPRHGVHKGGGRNYEYEWHNPGGRGNSNLYKPGRNKPGDNNNLKYTNNINEIHFGNSSSTTTNRKYITSGKNYRDKVEKQENGEKPRLSAAVTSAKSDESQKAQSAPRRMNSRTGVFGGGANARSNQNSKTIRKNTSAAKSNGSIRRNSIRTRTNANPGKSVNSSRNNKQTVRSYNR